MTSYSARSFYVILAICVFTIAWYMFIDFQGPIHTASIIAINMVVLVLVFKIQRHADVAKENRL